MRRPPPPPARDEAHHATRVLAVGDPLNAARWLAVFLLTGGGYVLVLSFAVPGHAGQGAVLALIRVLGAALVLGGLAILRAPRPVPQPILALGGPLSVLVIGGANLVTDDASTGSHVFMLLPVVFAASFLGLRANVGVLVAAIVVEAVTLALLESPSAAAADATALAVVFTLTGMAILAFRRRVDGAMAALATQAIEDPLTGLGNRRAFDRDLEGAVAVARRTDAPLSLVVLDVDCFKEVNDTLGHAAGDQALRVVAGVVRGAVRAGDVAARIGGDEFAMLLRACGREDAERVAEAVVARVREMTAAHESGRAVTVSSGVATMPDVACEADALTSAADQALYEAKARGRDRVAAAVLP